MSAAENIKSILTKQVGGYRALLDILRRASAGSLLHFNARSVEALSKGKGTPSIGELFNTG